MIQNYNNFQDKTKNLNTLKNLYLFNNDHHKTCDLLEQLYVFLITSCKRFHSQKIHMKKMKRTKN
jgi:hypothetical protein